MTASKHNTTINASQQVESCSKVLGFGELYAENQSSAVGQLRIHVFLCRYCTHNSGIRLSEF